MAVGTWHRCSDSSAKHGRKVDCRACSREQEAAIRAAMREATLDEVVALVRGMAKNSDWWRERDALEHVANRIAALKASGGDRG